MGKKFNLNSPVNKSDILDTIKNFESTEQYIEFLSNNKNTYVNDNNNNNYRIQNIRNHMTHCLNSVIDHNKHIILDERIFSNKFKLTKNFINNKKDLLITMADKSNYTV